MPFGRLPWRQPWLGALPPPWLPGRSGEAGGRAWQSIIFEPGLSSWLLRPPQARYSAASSSSRPAHSHACGSPSWYVWRSDSLNAGAHKSAQRPRQEDCVKTAAASAVKQLSRGRGPPTGLGGGPRGHFLPLMPCTRQRAERAP